MSLSAVLGDGLNVLDRRAAVRLWFVTVALGGGLYGAVMGTFSGWAMQPMVSAVKVPLLLIVTTLLAAPSFYVLNAAVGLGADFGQSGRAVLGSQAAVAVVLAALAPYTLLWYASTGDYHEASAFNLLTFAVAGVSAQVTLRKRYAALERRDPRHRHLRRVWIVLYGFVGIQLAWLLRPFVGSPAEPPSLFRDNPWGNAYVVVVELVIRAVGR